MAIILALGRVRQEDHKFQVPKNRIWGCSLMVKCLPSMCEALGLILTAHTHTHTHTHKSLTNKNKKRKNPTIKISFCVPGVSRCFSYSN
jgi:hypothetical protein